MRLQVGRPSLRSNASQLVLKYILSQKKSLCNTWRSRIYYYSSATTFSDVTDDVAAFVESCPRGHKVLRNLQNVGMCREVVGDALCSFIRRKPSFFKDAMISKKHFWNVPKWKRAMTFVFMLRFVAGKQGLWVLFRYHMCLYACATSFEWFYVLICMRHIFWVILCALLRHNL